jgi:hypothetical protein
MRSATLRLALIAALAGAVSASPPLRTVEAAPTAPTGSAPSAGPSASATAAPAKHGVPVSAYAWPTEASPEPREEDWAGATDLEVDPPRNSGGTSCELRALGAWLRITCAPSWHPGVLWGLAGDVAKVKGRFTLVSEVQHDNKPPKNEQEDAERQMGASATITLPIAPGSALLLRLDAIAWDEDYNWAGVVSRAGWLFDVSWALGEKHPTILYH